MSSMVSGWSCSARRSSSTSGLRSSVSIQTRGARPIAARTAESSARVAPAPSKTRAVAGIRGRVAQFAEARSGQNSADYALRLVLRRRAGELDRLQQLAPVLLHGAVQKGPCLVE